jgi:uncharacterized protein
MYSKIKMLMETFTISKNAARKLVLGLQGLWPGRRWTGAEGVDAALHSIEAIQMDPLNVTGRSHDIAMWGRVLGYTPEMLNRLMYQERRGFDYGGGLFVYPMAELPYWRLHMSRKVQQPRWVDFAAGHAAVLEQVKAELRQRGPLGNRDFTGNVRVNSYRGSKDTALALYYLWLAGEVMISSRKGFERIYDFRERVAPPRLDYAAAVDEAEDYFARKAIAFLGLMREKRWATGVGDYIQRHVDSPEREAWLQRLVEQSQVVPIQVEGSKERWLTLHTNLPLVESLESGHIPPPWQPCLTTGEEVVFLAPLDIVSARGRAAWLFDFEYIWEVYKPAAQRRWGYYTLPILYGDRLVARLDPRLERDTNTLVINGFWLEGDAPQDSPEFAGALARGLARFAAFLKAQRVQIAAIAPQALRERVQAAARQDIEIRA